MLLLREERRALPTGCRPRAPAFSQTYDMYTIALSSRELRLVESALHAYLDDFGHEEAELLRELKALIARLPPSQDHPDEALRAQSAVTEL